MQTPTRETETTTMHQSPRMARRAIFDFRAGRAGRDCFNSNELAGGQAAGFGYGAGVGAGVGPRLREGGAVGAVGGGCDDCDGDAGGGLGDVGDGTRGDSHVGVGAGGETHVFFLFIYIMGG